MFMKMKNKTKKKNMPCHIGRVNNNHDVNLFFIHLFSEKNSFSNCFLTWWTNEEKKRKKKNQFEILYEHFLFISFHKCRNTTDIIMFQKKKTFFFAFLQNTYMNIICVLYHDEMGVKKKFNLFFQTKTWHRVQPKRKKNGGRIIFFCHDKLSVYFDKRWCLCVGVCMWWYSKSTEFVRFVYNFFFNFNSQHELNWPEKIV